MRGKIYIIRNQNSASSSVNKNYKEFVKFVWKTRPYFQVYKNLTLLYKIILIHGYICMFISFIVLFIFIYTILMLQIIESLL